MIVHLFCFSFFRKWALSCIRQQLGRLLPDFILGLDKVGSLPIQAGFWFGQVLYLFRLLYYNKN